MKTIIFATFLLFSFQVWGQENCLYSAYFWHTSNAGSHFIRQDYLQAAKEYKLAFEDGLFPFGNDLENALETAIQQKDHKWAKSLAVQLAQ